MTTQAYIAFVIFFTLGAAEIRYMDINTVLYTGTCGGAGEFNITTTLTDQLIALNCVDVSTCKVLSAVYDLYHPDDFVKMGLQILRILSLSNGYLTLRANVKPTAPSCSRTYIRIHVILDDASSYKVLMPLGLFKSSTGTELIQIIPFTSVPGITMSTNGTIFMDLVTPKLCALQAIDFMFYDNNPSASLRCLIYTRSMVAFTTPVPATISASWGNTTTVRTVHTDINKCSTYPTLDFTDGTYGVLQCYSNGADWSDLYIVGVRLYCSDRPTINNC